MTSIPAGQTEAAIALQQSIAASRKLFVASMSDLRPRLHRFCARMCGSSLDGEDVVQETLADAFYKLATLKDTSRLEPWIFRIAYYKCVDFMRREQRRRDEVPFEDEHAELSGDDDASDSPVDDALAALVVELPPKERAAVVLKDVLGYPLAEVAEIAETTLAGVKAALHRGRSKLRARTGAPMRAEFDSDQRRLLEAYAECFNRRDWDSLKNLVRADARLELVGSTEGIMAGLGSTYHGNYTGLPWEWKLSVGAIDSAPAIVHWKRSGDEWKPYSAIRLWTEDGRVTRIRDYIHVAYLLESARIES